MGEQIEDWVDGFLMVGNHHALDLLNTHLVDDNGEHELLHDAEALVRWLHASEPTMPAVPRGWGRSEEAEKFREELLFFRESLRAAVKSVEAQKQPSEAFLRDLNHRLATHPVRLEVISKDGTLRRRQAKAESTSDALWSSILASTVDLIVDTNWSRVRQCENCVVHFRDVSKKNARRWCSMRLCGNKLKVAAYQKRQRQPI